jgi:ribulose-5-phosphate 4-epimerase/fuculose-1-phosphate aldolase
MAFASSPHLRAEVLTACRVLSHFRIVEGFGHVSARVPDSDRMLITPRKALGLVADAELVEVDGEGKQRAGEDRPPLEWHMHQAVYRRRPEVMAIARGHPRHVAAYASAVQSMPVAHGFGANLGSEIGVYDQPYLIADPDSGERVADALGNSAALILYANGMLSVGRTVAHASVLALFLEETAEIQLLARSAGMTPRVFTAAVAERRNGNDRVHEPLRAWEYYVAATAGKLP